MRKPKATYSGLVVVGASASVRDSKAAKLLSETGEASSVPHWRLLACGSFRWAHYKWSILCAWLGCI